MISISHWGLNWLITGDQHHDVQYEGIAVRHHGTHRSSAWLEFLHEL